MADKLSRPDLFSYLDYRKFLGDLSDFLKKSTRYFSLRYFSQKAGFGSPNYLKMIIEGKRNLSKKSIPGMVQALNLAKSEHEYFEHLVFFNQSKTNEEKDFYYKKLIHSKRGTPLKILGRDEYEYWSEWYNLVVRELIVLEPLNGDPELIGKRLTPQVPGIKVKQSIDLLKRLGLIKKKSNGKWVQTEKAVTTESQVYSLAITNYHLKAIELGKESIQRFEKRERNVSSITMGLSKKGFQMVEEKIDDFWKTLHTIASEEKTFDRVYQVNFQIFPMSSQVKK